MPQTPAETRSSHFDREATASTYRDIHLPRVFTPWAHVMLEIVPPAAGQVVLDVATGPGTVARPAARKVGTSGRVVGVDISAAMLNVARSFAAESDAAPIEYVESSATSIAFPDATFDVVYCQQGLQHMSDAMAALREIRRLLKPGGRVGVAIWFQSPFGTFRRVAADMGLSAGGPQPSEFGHDPDSLAQALRDAGFEDVQVQQRDMSSKLEGGVPEAVQLALATSAAAVLPSLSEAQQDAFRQALVREAQTLEVDGVVQLKSVSNLGSARRGG